MPTMSNIVLADAQATPVNRTFIPIGKDKNGTFWLEEQSAVLPAIGNWRISIERKSPTPAKDGQSSLGRTYRIKIGMHHPVLEAVSNNTASGIAPAPTIAYIDRSFQEFIYAERCVYQDRDSLTKMSYNLLANASILSIIRNLEEAR